MLTRVIAGSSDFRGLALTHDDELDAALALCGEIDLPSGPRYCLQTTYLNERYPEYGSLDPKPAPHLGAEESVLGRLFDGVQLEAIRT